MSQYKASDFDYHLPMDLIAQHPASERTASRLLTIDRAANGITHDTFDHVTNYFQPGDTLVLNTSRVMRARLIGTRSNGRSAEILLVRAAADDSWIGMVHPGGKLKVGRSVTFPDGSAVHVTDVLGGGLRRLTLTGPRSWVELMDAFGQIPLPPYIERDPEPQDLDRYQTVYADTMGSVAAPTAGLHFTDTMLGAIRERGVDICSVILHVGPGTFKPVQTDDPDQHPMHEEWYSVSEQTAQGINQTRARGGTVWAVGTTVTRVLETTGASGSVVAGTGWTRLFIQPPYTFQVVSGLITNFHLPRSTLLMLVAAFGGYDLVMQAYREAVAQRYRLFSYGDAMVLR